MYSREQGQQPDIANPNALSPKLGVGVEYLYACLNTEDLTQHTAQQPALEALRVQTVNHLRHVRFDFDIEDGSQDYSHDYVLAGKYPFRPSAIAIEKAEECVKILNTERIDRQAFEPVDEAREAELYAAQKEIARGITRDPLGSYNTFADRLKTEGRQASFPEFEPTVQLLRARLASSPDVQSLCEDSAPMERFRQLTLARVDALLDNDEVTCPYTDTILTIERATEFFDVIARANMGSDAPDLYHSGRYEYYLHYLLAQEDHILFPTASALGATDLIRIRGVPIGFVGVNTSVERVDGFKQTPYEFFHHDVNHSRRMFQFLSEAAAEQSVSVGDFAESSNEFIHSELLPLILPKPEDTEAERNHKIATRMLLFEILHEDALPAHADIMAEAIMRPPLMRTPFERIEEDDTTVTYFMEPGATTLAYVFRKMAHTFYDTPEQRFGALGEEDSRSRWEIVKAAIEVYKTVSNDPVEDEVLVRQLEQLVVTDEGFPEAFFNEVLDDMKERVEAKGRSFTFFVSKPQETKAALERIRTFGKKVHTLFGYSGLGYEQEPELLETIRQDLARFDPEETIVAIGATPEGIGAAYNVAKELGFFTLGIVSSKSIAHGGRYSGAVDDVIIVKDTEWGGYLPGTEQISPTTEVFIGASDTIAAYGGGQITATTMVEALARDVPMTFKPFKMLSADDVKVHQLGPAHQQWQNIQEKAS